MPWRIVPGAGSCITEQEINEILSLLPESLTADLGSVTQESDGLSRNRVRSAGLETARISGLGLRQDNRDHLVLVSPGPQASDYDRLKHAARFVPSFVRQICWHGKQAWPSDLLAEVADNRQTAWQQNPHRIFSRETKQPWQMAADLLSQGLTVQPTSEDAAAWRTALANRLCAQGMRAEYLPTAIGLVERLAQAAEPDYDPAQAAHELDLLRRAMIQRLAQAYIRKIIRSSAKDTYERAGLLHAIFAEQTKPSASDQSAIPSWLIDQLRDLAQEGDPHQTVALYHLASALQNI